MVMLKRCLFARYLPLPDTNLKLTGYLLALGATAFWSGNFIVATEFTDQILPFTLAFWRWLIAILALLPFTFQAARDHWPLIQKHFLYLSITAILGVTVFNTLLYIAGHSSNAINMSLIAITTPIYIIILARIIFRERITANQAMGILITLSGVIILITDGNPSLLLSIEFVRGDLWMLIAAISFAGYSILVKYKPSDIPAKVFLLATFILGLLYLSPFYLWEHLSTPPAQFSTTVVLSLLYVAIFASLFAFLFWNQAVQIIGPAKTGLIYYLIPVFSSLLAYLFQDQAVKLLHLISMALIVGGLLLATSFVRTRQQEN